MRRYSAKSVTPRSPWNRLGWVIFPLAAWMLVAVSLPVGSLTPDRGGQELKGTSVRSGGPAPDQQALHLLTCSAAAVAVRPAEAGGVADLSSIGEPLAQFLSHVDVPHRAQSGQPAVPLRVLLCSWQI